MNPIEKKNHESIKEHELIKADAEVELKKVDKQISALKNAEEEMHNQLLADIEKYKDQLPKDFTIEGTMKYKITFKGDDLLVQADFKEEDTLVNLFKSMEYFQSVENYSRTPKGKKQFSQEEKSKITITRRNLQLAIQSYGKVAYRKMISGMLADIKRAAQADATA